MLKEIKKWKKDSIAGQAQYTFFETRETRNVLQLRTGIQEVAGIKHKCIRYIISGLLVDFSDENIKNVK